jgi:predicted esterase
MMKRFFPANVFLVCAGLLFLAVPAKGTTPYSEVYVQGHRCLVIGPKDLPPGAPVILILHGAESTADSMIYLCDELDLPPCLLVLPDGPLPYNRSSYGPHVWYGRFTHDFRDMAYSRDYLFAVMKYFSTEYLVENGEGDSEENNGDISTVNTDPDAVKDPNANTDEDQDENSELAVITTTPTALPTSTATPVSTPKPRPVIILGTSQGGVMALTAGLNYQGNIAAIVSICGYLAYPERSMAHPKAPSGTPILLEHGTMDPIVQEEDIVRTMGVLKQAGYHPVLREHPIGHKITSSIIMEVSNFIQEALSKGTR